jgi:hypothetical protein
VAFVERWLASWFAPASLARLAIFRIGVASIALVDVVPTTRAVLAESRGFATVPSADAWRPIELLALFGGERPAASTLLAVGVVAVLALSAAFVGVFSRTACLVGALAHTWLEAVSYSYGRVHHDEVALTFALLCLPLAPCGAVLSFDAWFARRRGRATAQIDASARHAALPLRMTQLTIAIGYAAAGGSKLASSGVEWLNGWTLMSSFVHADFALGRALGSNLLLCRVLSWSVVLLQLGFPLVLWRPRLARFFLPAMLAFHLVSWFTLGTGSYATLWLLYIAFLPLERLAPRLFRTPDRA